MKKFVADNISSEVTTRFQDTSAANVFMELAQQYLDAGMEPKDIKDTLKTLYGATPEEIAKIDQELFKKNASERIDPSIKHETMEGFRTIIRNWEEQHPGLPYPQTVQIAVSLLRQMEEKEKSAGKKYVVTLTEEQIDSLREGDSIEVEAVVEDILDQISEPSK